MAGLHAEAPSAPPATAQLRPEAQSRQQVIVGIATTGRPGILRETLRHLATLPDRPDMVVVSTAGMADFDGPLAEELPFPLLVLEGDRGCCRQRNAILAAVPRAAVLVYIDDDFLPAAGFVEATRRLFAARPDVVMATGAVLADGIGGPGYDHTEGLARLAAAPPAAARTRPRDTYNAYGCNMAVRVATVADHGLAFDTALPAYGWLEDVDFSRNLARHGRVVRDPAMRGVHLGTKTGRSPGVPVGYSQIANPVYLIRKGTMSAPRALRMIVRNLLANTAKSLRPEPWVDRGGRLRGNMLAIGDLLSGRLSPGRILEL